MHFMSRLSAICVAALFIGIFPTQAQQDTPAQIKAREALRQKMKALQEQDTNQIPTQTSSLAPVSSPSLSGATSGSPAPVLSSPPASAVFSSPPPGSAQTSADSEAIAKARATLRQKLAELNAPAAPATAMPVAAKPVSKSQSSAAPAKAKTADTAASAKPAAEQTPVKPEAAPKPSPPKVMSARGLPPIGSPAPTISPAKQQQLQELLQLYQADKISPQDYHDRRAKILAEP